MLLKILSLAERHGFVKRMLPHPNLEELKVGPTGLLLQENLKNEWFCNTVMHKDMAIFLNRGDILETFDYVKDLCIEKLPFGIAEIKYENGLFSDSSNKFCNRISNHNMQFARYFPGDENTIVKCSIFVSPSNSIQLFHQLQRQRRMWWRKFSACPDRYVLTDLKANESGVQYCEILAEYPWGSQLVESISFNKTDRLCTQQQLQFKDGKKVIQAQSIISEINMSVMFLNSLCDAYDEIMFHGNLRELLRFHRKLAPYKMSFAVTGQNANTIAELNDLAKYLCKQLRTSYISTLLLPSSSKHSLDAQYKQYDQLGVPYTVILNENTLKNGIIHLRSRDTTLKEQVHVTDLVEYVEQLYKNY